VQIEKKQIAHNRKKRTGKILYIVIHDTGNTKKGADSEAHFNYFNGGERGASADFFVDSKRVLQVNDYEQYYTYHVGDGKGKYGITNQNAVGVELCVNEDGDYETAFKNTVELTKHLMQVLNIPIERVVRHYDASRKNCPQSMDEAKWAAFKAKVLEEKKMDCKFKDISDHFAKKQIEELFKMGVVNGKDDTHFAPDAPVTRAEAAVIARNVIRYVTGK